MVPRHMSKICSFASVLNNKAPSVGRFLRKLEENGVAGFSFCELMLDTRSKVQGNLLHSSIKDTTKAFVVSGCIEIAIRGLFHLT